MGERQRVRGKLFFCSRSLPPPSPSGPLSLSLPLLPSPLTTLYVNNIAAPLAPPPSTPQVIAQDRAVPVEKIIEKV